METLKVKITAQACIIRFIAGEDTLKNIVDRYNPSSEYRALILTKIKELDESMDITLAM